MLTIRARQEQGKNIFSSFFDDDGSVKWGDFLSFENVKNISGFADASLF